MNPKKYSIFEDGPAGHIYYEETPHPLPNEYYNRGYYSLVTSFDTEGEAKKYVTKQKAYFSRLQDERDDYEYRHRA